MIHIILQYIEQKSFYSKQDDSKDKIFLISNADRLVVFRGSESDSIGQKKVNNVGLKYETSFFRNLELRAIM